MFNGSRFRIGFVGLAVVILFPNLSHALSITKTNSTFASVDGSSTTRTVSILAGDITAGDGLITDVDITIDFAKCGSSVTPDPGGGCNGFGFSFNNEIVYSLTSPGSTTVSLIASGTFSGGNQGRVQMTFDDAAATPVGGFIISPGTFQPVGLLSSFNGESAVGLWTLFIQDTVGVDPMGFYSYDLNVTTTGIAAVPEPATLLLLGSGLAGLVGWRWKQGRLKQAA